MGAKQALVQAGQTHGPVQPRMPQHQGANHRCPGHAVNSVLTSLSDNNSCYHTEISALQRGIAKQHARDGGWGQHGPIAQLCPQELHPLLHSAQESLKCLARSGSQVNSVFYHAERKQAVGTSFPAEAHHPILQGASRPTLLPPALSCSPRKDGWSPLSFSRSGKNISGDPKPFSPQWKRFQLTDWQLTRSQCRACHSSLEPVQALSATPYHWQLTVWKHPINI